jgi:capsular exopolysaccharide synthesis family protein
MNEKKMVIEWHSVLRDLLRNAWVIVCAALIGVLSAYVFNHVIYSPEYTSGATLIINSAEGKTNAVASLSLASEIANIYSEVFVQPTMKQKVCEDLGRESFDGRINAVVNAGTNIMELSVTASNPEVAFRELRSILKVYPQITNSLYSNGVVSVLRSASVPRAPSNRMTSASVIKVAGGSMALAALLIMVLSVIRDTVKGEKGFSEQIDAKLLGVIPHEKKQMGLRDVLKKKKRGILLSESAFTSLRFTENFNKIDSKLEYMNRTHGDRVFVVTSAAENEGKSTVASNLAISLAIRGNRVALVDLDGKKPALYKIFEQARDDEYELGNMLAGKTGKKYRFRRYKKLNLFLALNTKPHKEYQTWIENGTVEMLLRAFRNTVDYVIVDTAPISVDGAVTSIAKLCDATILVVRTNTVFVPILNDVILTLRNTGAKFAGCILNDVYDEFSLFNQMGLDESGYARYSKYARYGRYGKYGRYGRYGRYGGYGAVAGQPADDDAASDDAQEMEAHLSEGDMNGGKA